MAWATHPACFLARLADPHCQVFLELVSDAIFVLSDGCVLVDSFLSLLDINLSQINSRPRIPDL
jgi:hypothetical protein